MQLWSLGKGSRTPGPKGPGPGTPNLFEEVTYLGPKSQALEPQDSELRDQRGRTKVTGQPLCLMPQRNSTAWSSWAVPHLPGHPQGRRHAGPPPTAGQHSPLHGPRSDGHHALRAGSEPLVGQVQDPEGFVPGWVFESWTLAAPVGLADAEWQVGQSRHAGRGVSTASLPASRCAGLASGRWAGGQSLASLSLSPPDTAAAAADWPCHLFPTEGLRLRSGFREPAGHCGVLGGAGRCWCQLLGFTRLQAASASGRPPPRGRWARQRGAGPRPDCSGMWARPPPSLHWAWCPPLELGVGLPCPSRPFQPHQSTGYPTPLCSPSAPPSWVPGTPPPPRLPTHQENQTLALFRGSSGRLSGDLRALVWLTRQAQPSARS